MYSPIIYINHVLIVTPWNILLSLTPVPILHDFVQMSPPDIIYTLIHGFPSRLSIPWNSGHTYLMYSTLLSLLIAPQR